MKTKQKDKQTLLKKPQQIKQEMEAGAELSPAPVQDAVQSMKTKPRVQKAKPEGPTQNFGGGWGVDGAFYHVDKEILQQTSETGPASLETDLITNQVKDK